MTKKYTVSKLLLVVFMMIGGFVSAQNTPKGTIVGKIIDAKTGETLPGAIAIIEGSNQGASADLDGNFTISNVPVGTHSVVIKFISYKSKQITDVVVEQGKAAKITVSMESSANDLSEVVITASAKRETVASLLIQQKNSMNVSDGISAETIKRSPDRNTGDAIKRVSGASIQDNKYAIIRGLNDRYNTAMINGAPLPTSEPDRRAFSFDIFPSSLVDNLVITKTASADMPAEFAGGIISINTKDIPDENYYNISASGGFNSQSTGKEFFSPATTGKYDWLGIDDGTRAIPDGIPEKKLFMANETTREQQIEWTKLFKNDLGTNKGNSLPPSQTYQFNMGQKFKVAGNDMGSVFALSYNNNRRTVVTERAEYQADGKTEDNHYTDTAYNSNTLVGALWNLGYKIGDNNKISFNNTYTINGLSSILHRHGSADPTREEYMSFQEFTSTRLYSSQLQGEHLLPWQGIKVKWGASTSETHRDLPNRRAVTYFKNYPNPDDADSPGDSAYVVQVGSANPNSTGRFFSKLYEKLQSARTDVAVPFTIGKHKQTFKTGYYFQQRHREFSARAYGYVISNNSKYQMNSGKGKDVTIYDESSIFSDQNLSVSGFQLNDVTNLSDNYTGSSTLNAGYVMLENTFTDKLKLAWGVRVESYNQKFFALNYSGDSIQIDSTVVDVLPSFNFVYSPTEKVNIRLSASKTLSRPEFREIAPFSFYDFTNNALIQGEPKLQRTNINNYDVRVELYPGEGQLFAVTGFYKRFDNAIEQIISPGSSGGSRIFTYQNVKKATAQGLELEWRQKLTPISKLINWKQFENITFFTNLSFIKSEVKVVTVGVTQVSRTRALQGQSPYIYNAGLTYNWADKGTNFTMMYNQVGRRIAIVGNQNYKDVYENPRPVLDLQVSQRVFKGADLKITLGDVMNKSAIFYQDFDDNGKYDEGIDTRIRNIKYGYNVTVGFSYKF